MRRRPRRRTGTALRRGRLDRVRRAGLPGGHDVRAGPLLDGRATVFDEDSRVCAERADNSGWPSRWSCSRWPARNTGGCSRSASAGRTASWSTCRPRCASRRADADRTLRGASAAAGRRPREHRRAAARSTASVALGDGARAELRLQQPQLLVRAGPVTDYCDGDDPLHRATSLHRGVQRRAGAGIAVSCCGLPLRMATPRKLHVFSAPQPVRYLACVTSRFTTMDPPPPGASAQRTSGRIARSILHLLSTARQRGRARESLAKAARHRRLLCVGHG